MAKTTYRLSAPTKRLSEYMAGARRMKLPANVVEKTKHHILDTLAAIISGSRLVPGERAISFIKPQGGAKEATVIGTKLKTSAINAALANAIMAHADETDDSHFLSNMHPGSVIVPAALAMSERQGSNGQAFLRSVTLGYDIGARVNMVLSPEAMRKHAYDSHSFGGNFGGAAAAAMHLKLNAQQMRHVLSYAAQQTSGMRTWGRDPEHVEKAFVFSGMAARNGVTAALMIDDGFTGVEDVFSGNPNYFDIYVEAPKRRELTALLGKRFEVIRTNIKRWSVGSPAQAALDATQDLIDTYGFKPNDIEKIEITLTDHGAKTVDNRDMPDICAQHLVAMMFVDGTATFESTHDYKRMSDPKILALRKKTTLKGSMKLEHATPPRQGIVSVTPKGGKKVTSHTKAVRGTADNPMTRDEVETKAYDLIAPILGKKRSKNLITKIWGLEKVKNVRKLRELLTA
ncbi:MAG: MmgE/PrpD family protein [Rhodospirillales bacterium]|jgi:2-methylcitrate dehydratase PrpD